MDIMDIAIAKALAGGGGGGGGASVINVSASIDSQTGDFVIDSIDKSFDEVWSGISRGGSSIARINIAVEDSLTKVDLPMTSVQIFNSNGEEIIDIFFKVIDVLLENDVVVGLSALEFLMPSQGNPYIRTFTKEF